MELSKFQRPAKTELQGIKAEDLPGPNVLLAPGKRDGQTVMVRDGGGITVHSWSESEQKWTKVGDVVGQPGDSDGPEGAAPDGGKARAKFNFELFQFLVFVHFIISHIFLPHSIIFV